ncbi:MAG: hypothetical protein VB081_02120 [Christensenella sp.]|uniref:hypothetical protein n=1 Tax=Christensenella sp. TaxID=1935934 RepID=UPI002B1F1E15|nr:hypothetical protein [Christensenella sp.]MEA5002276.1 hypothetical protein [Christensenella sp.]
MAVVSIIVSIFGLIASFVLGFPLSLIIGPYVGIGIGGAGLVLALLSRRKQKSNVVNAALIISIIVLAICVIRIISFVSFTGNFVGWIAGLFQ